MALTLIQPRLASAAAEPRSRWSRVCETVLETTVEMKDTVRGIASEALRWLWFGIDRIFPGGQDWRDAFTTARMTSNRNLRTFNEREWRDPVRLAHVVNRLPRQARALLEILRDDARRASFNHDTLAWKFKFYRDHRSRMQSYLDEKPPKYLAMTLDDAQINAMVARDFPNFTKQADLRAVEIAVAPAFLFGAEQLFPRPYRRFDLVILRNNMVVKSYRTLDLVPLADSL